MATSGDENPIDYLPFNQIGNQRHRTGRSLRRVAVHEAGHAVIATVLGERVDYVSLDNAVTVLARLDVGRLNGKSPVAAAKIAKRRSLILYAGVASELELMRPRSKVVCWFGSGVGDARDLSMLAGFLLSDSDKTLEHETRCLVRVHRGKIEVIARRLLIWGVLSGQQVIRMAEEAA